MREIKLFDRFVGPYRRLSPTDEIIQRDAQTFAEEEFNRWLGEWKRLGVGAWLKK